MIQQITGSPNSNNNVLKLLMLNSPFYNAAIFKRPRGVSLFWQHQKGTTITRAIFNKLISVKSKILQNKSIRFLNCID